MKISYKTANLIFEYVNCNKRLQDLKRTQDSNGDYKTYWQNKKEEIASLLKDHDIEINIKS